MGRKVLAAKSGRAACSCAAAGGGIAAKNAKGAKSFLTGLTGFTGLREVSVKPAKTKPSGVSWIGDIPEGWEVRRLRYLAEITTGNKDTQDAQPDGNYPFYVRSPVIERSNEYTFEGPGIMMAGDGAGAGRIFHYADGKYAVHQRVYRIYDFKDVTACFLLYFLGAMFPLEMDKGSAQSTVPSVRLPMLRDLQVSLPPLPVQRAIAAFLDEKCGAIDAAVAEAKKGIEEYKAWKKSLIFEVVTGKRRVGFFNAESKCARDEVVGLPERSEPEGLQGAARRRVAESFSTGLTRFTGLDENLDNPVNPVKTKPSGVPWIGDVPVGWEVCKTLHSLCMPITDGPHTTPELFDDGIPFVSAEAVSCGNGSIDFNHVRGFISEAFYNECCRKYIPQRDDIYMIKSGATTGRVAIVDTDRIFTIWSPLAVFRCNLKRAKPRYVFYYLQSSAYQGQVELAWSFGTQQNIGMRALEELKMVLPPLTEQRAIANYLDDKCAAIDAMVAEKNALIADLEAYKKSLIYEIVTGKREVSNINERKKRGPF